MLYKYKKKKYGNPSVDYNGTGMLLDTKYYVLDFKFINNKML